MANPLGIPELTSSQAQKFDTVNLAIKYLTAIITGARDIATSPPGSPVEGGMYIIGAGGNTGVWSSFAVGDMMFYFNAAWYRLTPIEGIQVWVWDEDAYYHHSGSAWVAD